MKQFMRIYFRQQKRQILTALLFCAIFSVIFLLYQLPPEGVVYPLLLCAVAYLAVTVMDMRLAWQRYRSLQHILKAAGLEQNQETFGEEAGRGRHRHRTRGGREVQERSEEDGQAEEHCDWELFGELLRERRGSEEWECAVYRELVERLLKERRQQRDDLMIQYQDTIDYYTTWVHQIKTPIASMGLALQKEDTEDSRRLSEDLQRIEQYVDMVLTYLRLGSQETDYVFTQVNLDRLLRDCIKKYASQFIRRHLALYYQGVDCLVLTDEKWLSFVVGQVLSNALKYTRSGSVSIYMEAPLTLCIQDTGIGISPEDLPRIFEKGYTGYNGRSDKKATGLGLYLCKQVCDRLRHSITAQSLPGEGTTIRIGLRREVLEVE